LEMEVNNTRKQLGDRVMGRNQGCPIVISHYSFTEQYSAFDYFHLHPIDHSLPFNIKDFNYFLPSSTPSPPLFPPQLISLTCTPCTRTSLMHMAPNPDALLQISSYPLLTSSSLTLFLLLPQLPSI
jgi:hypothetical protein